MAETPCPATSNRGAAYACGDQGGAYSACKAADAAYTQAQSHACEAVQGGPATFFYACKKSGSAGGCDPAGPYYFYPATETCYTRPPEYNWQWGGQFENGTCYNGCTYLPTIDLDSGDSYYSTTGSTCTSEDHPEPRLDTDNDGVPDDEDAFPNDPNESADSDGDGIGDNADFSPNDPTDGSDEPGEEDGDDEGDNTASGGGDCKAPPSCKGDGIQCNQLFQQWQIRCSGATVTGDPTNCSSGYSCSGDSVQCATVALLRKTACATAGNGDGGTGGTPGDANGNGVADVLEGSGAGDTGDPGESDNVTRFGIGVDASLLDQENIFGGGSCPTPPSLTIMGKTISGSDFPYWCQAMAILRALILIFGAFTAVKILTGWGFS